MAQNSILIALVMIISICQIFINADAFEASPWYYDAHATFYGGSDASDTMAGACGYGNTYTTGYGIRTAALSSVLYNGAASCGQCFRIVCNNKLAPRFCIKGKSITVTVTNLCPPNWALPNDQGGWCNPPRKHFDMTQPAFEQIALYVGGIVPVLYRRVPCKKHGGMRFTINGNPWFYLILATNVGAAGSIQSISIKGSKTDWIPMSFNWGANWETSASLTGQALSFKVTASDGKVVTCLNIASSDWGFGLTYSDKYCQF